MLDMALNLIPKWDQFGLDIYLKTTCMIDELINSVLKARG